LRRPGAQTSAAVIAAPVLVGDDVPAHLLTLDTGEQSTGEQSTGEDSNLLLRSGRNLTSGRPRDPVER
jgi:hypothetical protein